MKHSIVALALVFLFSSCHSVQQTTVTTPREFLQHFLDLYQNCFIPSDGISSLTPYLTSDLNEEFKALLKLKEQADPKKDDLALAEGLFNKNFFFGMNTSSSPEYRVGHAKTHNNDISIPVTLLWSSKVVSPDKSTATFILIRDKESFRISDVSFSYPKGEQMLLTMWLRKVTSSLKSNLHAEQGAAANP